MNATAVVEEPWACKPIRVITSQSKPGIRVCFNMCRNVPRPLLEAALELLEGDESTAPLVKDVRQNGFRRGPIVPFSSIAGKRDAVSAVIQAIGAICGADPGRG
jgi:hypothetical protein